MLKALCYAKKEPLRLFAIAAQYKCPWVRKVARRVAKELLRHQIPFPSGREELEHISAATLQRLYEYHTTCGRTSSGVNIDMKN
jgi:hypothetical protein